MKGTFTKALALTLIISSSVFAQKPVAWYSKIGPAVKDAASAVSSYAVRGLNGLVSFAKSTPSLAQKAASYVTAHPYKTAAITAATVVGGEALRRTYRYFRPAPTTQEIAIAQLEQIKVDAKALMNNPELAKSANNLVSVKFGGCTVRQINNGFIDSKQGDSCANRFNKFAFNNTFKAILSTDNQIGLASHIMCFDAAICSQKPNKQDRYNNLVLAVDTLLAQLEKEHAALTSGKFVSMYQQAVEKKDSQRIEAAYDLLLTHLGSHVEVEKALKNASIAQQQPSRLSNAWTVTKNFATNKWTLRTLGAAATVGGLYKAVRWYRG